MENFEKEVSSIISEIRRILGAIPYQMKIQKTELKEICELVDSFPSLPFKTPKMKILF